ncbi:MAG: cobalamin biosynthesis protein CbiD [Clostridia bacterium]|nr:cobalamin biosynthesis protein CbiD [Clostridia bacterium]
MNEFIIQDGKKLRLGYTTGSCAAAASKAAAYMLLSGRRKERITLETPKGITLELDIEDIRMTEAAASCAVRKDAGDDPDITDGALVYSKVGFCPEPGVHIDGGEGVGRVTKPGLDQPVGNAAINSVPRSMIRENVEEVMRLLDCREGLNVVISIPDGAQLAKKTFNPRLGIVGGISVLGTTGIVEPMSEKALVDTIRTELNQRRALGHENALLTPGNYGAEFIKTSLGIDPEKAVQTSNFIGDSLDICRELGFKRILLIGHIGKLVKLAGNMMNTHSKYGDCRMEIIAAHAGANGASKELVGSILGCVACDEAVRLMREADPALERAALEGVTKRAEVNLSHRAGEEMSAEMIMFSKEYGVLGETENAREYLKLFMEE